MKKKIAVDSAQFKTISSEQLQPQVNQNAKKMITKNYKKIDNIL